MTTVNKWMMMLALVFLALLPSIAHAEFSCTAAIGEPDADAWGNSVELLATSEQSPTSSLRMGAAIEIPVFVYTATQEFQMTHSHARSSIGTTAI